ncbi:MAG: hypothetical protein JNK29_02385, partial [Anaerolineales bacterium]|nr:hypothetical protein [Anaerolineales bacterium]
YKTVGDVMEILALDENRLLKMEGFNARYLEEVRAAVGRLTFPEVEPEPAPAEPEAPAEAAAPETAAAPAGEAAAPEAAAAPAGEAVAPAGEAAEESEELEDPQFKDDEEEEEDDATGKKKGKKKGKKARATVEIEYDEELGVYITRKKRKASRAGDMLGGLEE